MIPRWYQNAIDLIGVKEIKGPKDDPEIVAMFQATGYHAPDDETPWCGAFVAHCLRIAGVDYASVYAVAAGARNWASYGTDVESNPSIGAIIGLGNPATGKVTHVTFFAGWVDKKAGLFRGLGGNQGDSVKISTYRKENIMFARWPKGEKLPGAATPLRKSGVVNSAVLSCAGGATLLGSNADELIGALTKAKGFNDGSLMGILIGLLVVGGALYTIYSRVKGARDETKLAGG